MFDWLIKKLESTTLTTTSKPQNDCDSPQEAEAQAEAEAVPAMDPREHPKYLAFDEGDITISLSPSEKDTLVLHTSQLEDKSMFFKASLSHNWSSNKISNTITGDMHSRSTMRYELCLDEDGDWFLEGKTSESSVHDRQEDIDRFNLGNYPTEAIDTSESPRLDCEELRFLSLANPFSEVMRDHRNLFALLCHSHLMLQSSEVAKDILANVVFLADRYDCLQAVSKTIESCILVSSHAGDADVAKYPFFYLNLAAKIGSDRIFSEAFRHSVGKWDSLEERYEGCLTDDVALMLQSKFEELHLKVSLGKEEINELPELGSVSPNPDVRLATNIFWDWTASIMIQASASSDRTAYRYVKLLSDTRPRGLNFYLKFSNPEIWSSK